MYRFTVSFILLLSIIGSRSYAQTYFTATEVGISVGGSQYFGDLNENYGFQTMHLDGGLYVRKRMNMYIALKLCANYTNVSYDDKYNTDLYDRTRNLNFKSQIFEGAIQAEFNFFGFVTGDPTHRFTPYLTGGIGGFYYDPYTVYNGQKYDLKNLGTEGQFAGYGNRKYNNASFCFPVGAGVKIWLVGGVNLTLEIADRLTTTDYMDDVSSTYVGADKFKPKSVALALQDRSTENNPNGTPLGIAGKQRGNTSSKDQYMIGEISISFNFISYRCPSAERNDVQLRIR